VRTVTAYRQSHRYVLTTLFCVTFLYPFNVSYAVFGVNFDGWTVSDGVIDSACPSVVGVASCEQSVEDNGFMQRIIVMDDGKRYIQRIVTDLGANGDPNQEVFTANSLSFAMEDFVEMNRDYTANPIDYASHGITTKFTVAESKMTGDIEERFSYAVRFDSGPQFDTGPAIAGLDAYYSSTYSWMDSAYDVSTTTIQEIDWSQLGSPEELFFSSATIKNTPNQSSPRPEHILDQRINLGGGDSQQFKYHLLQGSQQQTSHTLADPFLLPGGSNGGNFAYAAGDALSATWIGQSMANAGLPDNTSAEFSHTSFDEQLPWEATTGTIAYTGYGSTSLTSLTSTEPAAWLIDPFGPVPTMTAPDPITAVAWSAPTAVIGTVPAAATLLTDTTPGGPPIALDAWSVTDGVIAAADCPPGAECGVALTDTDFFQREVIKDGKRYFQTIITDGNATGTPGTGDENFQTMVARNGFNAPVSLQPGVLGFATESFVQAGANSGLSSKQQVAEVESNYGTWVLDPPQVYYDYVVPPELLAPGSDPQTIRVTDPSALPPELLAVLGDPVIVTITDLPQVVENTLSYTNATINTGWAQGGDASPSVKLAQLTTTEIDPTGSFSINPDSMTTRFDMFAVPSGAKEIMVAQDHQVRSSFGDDSGFRMHYIDGALQNNTRLLTDPALLPDGGNIAWSPGDTIKAVWSGEVIGPFPTSQGMGLTAYTNLTTGESVSLTRVKDSNAQGISGNLYEGTGTWYDNWMVFNANSWVAPFNTSSPTRPGINYNPQYPNSGPLYPTNWGTYGCNYTLVSLYPGC